MTIQLYDLAFRGDRRLSPYCWRIKFALAHKGLAYETIPVGFSEKQKIAFSGQTFVPVLVDGDRVVCDSWDIALYLDKEYPHTARLFDNEQSRARTLFIKNWCERVLQIALFRLVALDIHRALEPADQSYFRESREKRIGMRLEDYVADVKGNIKSLQQCLEPLRGLLKTQACIDGEHPGFGDYLIAGAFVWACGISSTQLLDPSDPVDAWRLRLFEAFGGLAAKEVAKR
jgi:glutathione S-transferase